ncbi:MAG: hypothetical protein BGO51_24085 [Rhodospirillales bacterium 69-11]|nr:MCE family protein [Rhodospirillales bacterium]OJW22323.1 MAG: hypothetical protein BGO51_24085 [Rhodospirillales bacterium 69-11]
MNDITTELPADPVVRHRRRLSIVWLIPILAVLLAGFLLWRSWSQQGPTINISFRTAEGIEVGKTKVKLKAVDIGTVSAVHIAPDRRHVIVSVDMSREATEDLTDRARFWLVKARISAGSVSGLDTLLSGSYIAIDPGPAGGKPQRDFKALETPPVIASDEPGRSFLLHAARLGSIGPGSPIFYHGLTVGEILGYDLGPNADSVTLHAFVRAPYDQYVHKGSHFWNASGITFATDPDGFKVKLESLAAILSGGVAFDTPKEMQATAVAEDGQDYPLYEDQDSAQAAGYSKHINVVTFFQGSVRGLSVGSPVELFGIRIGSVTGISLHLDPIAQKLGVAVHLEVQPERFKVDNADQDRDPSEVLPILLRAGLRTQLKSTSLLTGQLAVALDFFPDAPPATLQMQGDTFVLPSEAGDIDSITRSVSDIAGKLNRLPLDKIGDSLLQTLQSADALVASPELKSSLQSVAQAADSLRSVMHNLDEGLGPTLKKLPALTNSLQQATDRAGKALGSMNDGYGTNSEFYRGIQRLLGQMTDMTRAIRFLVEFLDEHPEALVRGRTEEGRSR